MPLIEYTPRQELSGLKVLTPQDAQMMWWLLAKHSDNKTIQEISTACKGFYKGCTCPGCELADEHSPFGWPKVRECK
jgi:hypothetical protein